VEGAATVYVPTPPLPVPSAVTTVPGMMPGPVTGVPTPMVPALTPVTVIVVPEMEETKAGATGGTPAVIATELTVCGMLTVYVPVAPLPEPSEVTTVPAAMPGPTMGAPRESEPDCTELTVSVVPEMEPVTAAAGVMPTRLEGGTLCGTATVYVPAPPVPVPSADTTAPAGMPAPMMGMPTAMEVPAATDVTVMVLPEKEAT
jgi:hypothetical protein